jgi:hypothetical protein
MGEQATCSVVSSPCTSASSAWRRNPHPLDNWLANQNIRVLDNALGNFVVFLGHGVHLSMRGARFPAISYHTNGINAFVRFL